MEITTSSAKETQDFGREIITKLIKEHNPLILALTGNLGSGKTTFVQGVAKGLGIKQRILSPTFIIMRQYDTKEKGDFYHIDLYRLDKNVEEEMRNLGAGDIFKDKDNIAIIEWAEKGRGAIPKNAIWMTFENIGGDKRKINLRKP
jgi:tRNA threonylcarbamoyladenosine biosynthesis protein TsaE